MLPLRCAHGGPIAWQLLELGCRNRGLVGRQATVLLRKGPWKCPGVPSERVSAANASARGRVHPRNRAVASNSCRLIQVNPKQCTVPGSLFDPAKRKWLPGKDGVQQGLGSHCCAGKIWHMHGTMSLETALRLGASSIGHLQTAALGHRSALKRRPCAWIRRDPLR